MPDDDAPTEWTLRPLHRLSTENRYGLVILSIIVTYCVTVADTGTVGALVVIGFQLLTVWLALSVSQSRHVRRAAGVCLTLVGLGAIVGGLLGYAVEGSSPLTGFAYVVNTVLYLIAPVLIVLHLARRPKVDLQSFLGAIAAYLLLGMMFAFAYRSLGELQSSLFFGADGDGSAADDLFFSFVTLTTTGYGNLVPAGNPGQSVAVLEAITGQLFLITAVAKVVTAWNPLANRPPQ